MLSRLSKGYGSWTAGYVDPYYKEKKDHDHLLPDIDVDSHVHGVTVSSRSGRTTAMSLATKRSREPTSDNLHIPKTYTTKCGALQLYVAPDDVEDDEEEEGLALQPKYVQIKRPMGQELIDLSLKLGTMDRLAMSVLQFGDQEFDNDHTSISDAKNKAFLKFLHSIDDKQQGAKGPIVDSTVQPGGNLNSYLRDLKNSAASMKYARDGSMYIPKSRESMELQAILRGLDTNMGWPMSFQQDMFSDKQSTGQFTRPVSRVSSRGPSPGPPSTPRSSYQVLSSKKLAASIKSGCYLGRPSSRLSADDEELSESELGGLQHVTSASVTKKGWSPSDSADNLLLDTREKFYRGSVASGSIAGEDSDSDDGKKRRRLKERSFLTGSDLLYQGRNARKVEGQREGDGEGQMQGIGQGHGMFQIKEEHDINKRTSGNASLVQDDENDNDDSESMVWAKKVADAHRKTSSVDTQQTGDIHAVGTDIIDVKIEENDKMTPRPPVSRPSSHVSVSSTSSKYSSKQAPSVITIQTGNKPRPQSAHDKFEDKYLRAHKRRKSFSSNMLYDPERSKQAYLGGGRRMSENAPKFKGHVQGHAFESVSQSHDNNASSSSSFARTSGLPLFGPGTVSWSSMTNQTKLDKVPDSPHSAYSDKPDAVNDQKVEPAVQNAQEIISESSHSGIDFEQIRDRLQDYIRPDSATHDQDIMDNVIHDEDIIDNIEACNKEVKQIEDKAAADGFSAYSDSEISAEDKEELIKVMANETEEKAETITDDIKTEDVNIPSEEGDAQEITTEEEALNLDRQLESRALSVSKTESEVNVEESVEVIGEGQDLISVDKVEVDQMHSEDKEVDEVGDEDLQSLRSSRRLLSKLSGDAVSEGAPGTEDGQKNYLTGEQVGQHGDGSQLPLDAQTGFSGSTDSYSDVLASDRNSRLSRPASAALSRPSSGSAGKNSRPTSASQIPTATATATSSRPSSKESLRPISGKLSQPASELNTESASAENLHQGKMEQTEDAGMEDNVNANVIDGDADIGDTVQDITQVPDMLPEASESADNPTDVLKEESSEIKIDETKATDEGQNVKDSTVNKKSNYKPLKQVPVKTQRVGSRYAGGKRINDKAAVENKKPEVAKTTVKETKAQSKNVQETGNSKVGGNTHEAIHDVKKSTKNEADQDIPEVVGKSENEKIEIKKTIEETDKPATAKAMLETSRVEGEGKLDLLAGQGNSLSEIGEGVIGEDIQTKDVDSSDNEGNAHAIASELDALGLRKPASGTGKKKGKKDKSYTVVPPGPRPKVPQEKTKIPDHLLDAMKHQPSESYQNMEKDLERRGFLKDGEVTDLVDESLSGPTLEAVGEGLTEEELELAKQILMKKIGDAREKLDGNTGTKAVGKKKSSAKVAKKAGKKKKGPQVDERTEEEKERDAIKEKQEFEKQKRDLEAQDLQRKIAERRLLLQAQEDMASAASKELQEQMEQLQREADDLQRAEDEARSILSDVRKKQREEREQRRKIELDRKRQDAFNKREKEKKDMDEKRRKEMEMMELIADGEMRRRLREEEERKMYEEERLAQERYEEELREAQRQEEEEEERLKEMEREAEEEAMKRLIEEREAAERQRRRLYEEEEKMREAELLKREFMLEEENRLHEERAKIEAAENERRDLERQNLMELRRLEEEARAKMMEEVEQRRNDAISRRDHNLENKVNSDKLRHYQGITRAWTFSYFVRWPRDTYESHSRSRVKHRRRPIGDPDPRKKVKIKNPQPKAKVDPPPDADGNNTPAAT